MKISILTPTYNRENHLSKLYNSIIENSKYNVELEWIIMDDGSTDATKQKIEKYINDNKINIKYFYQENQGKMRALNNIIKYAEGELIIECDSDDYLKSNAIKTIKEVYENLKEKENIYALVFLKYNQNLCNIGNNFKYENSPTTMFDLYYKQGLEGDKAIVFISEKRKKYNYILEKNEKFSTEARMHHKMDKSYKVVCFNKPLMICEYLQSGYSQNMKELFLNNRFSYFEYFREMFEQNMKGLLLSKRLYIIKHYILFSCLTKQKNVIKNVKGILNKVLTTVLIIPRIY